MSTARKYRPNWDEGFYIARSDPERIPKPRLQATVVEMPKRVRLDPARAIAAWRAIGVHVTEEGIRELWARIQEWQRRVK